MFIVTTAELGELVLFQASTKWLEEQKEWI